MKLIRLGAIFLMLFSLSALAAKIKSSDKNFFTECKPIQLEIEAYFNTENYSNFNFTFNLPGEMDFPNMDYPINTLKDSIDPIEVLISYIKNPQNPSLESLQSGEKNERLGEEIEFLKVKVLASGTIGSPKISEKEDSNDPGIKYKEVYKTKWVQFHISAVDETSSFIRKAVNGTDGVTGYGICTEYSSKRIKK